MTELSFKNIFTFDNEFSSKRFDSDILSNVSIRNSRYNTAYPLALQSIELLRNIKVEDVTPELAFMYAVDNDDKELDTLDPSTWDRYAGKHEKEIKANTILNCLNLIDLLIEPFRIPVKDVYTMGLPKDVSDRLDEINFKELFVILNSESYNDFNPLPVLELSIRNLTNHSRMDNEDPYDSCSRYRGYTDVLSMEQIYDIFKPFIDKCSFNEDNDPLKLIKKYPSRKIRQYALLLSIMYRLFYFIDRTPEELAEVYLSNDHCTNFRNRDLSANSPIISWILSIPYISPEVAVGITTPRRYSCKKKFMPSIPEIDTVKSYLILLYRHLVSKEKY